MIRAPRIVAMAGSLRKGSFNEKLVGVAAKMLRDKGAEVTVIKWDKFQLPIFGEDIEKEGTPTEIKELKAIFNKSDGVLVASPEYNGSMSPLLVNAICWLSRQAGDPDEPMYHSFANKAGLVISTSLGGLGGLRGLSHIRELLTNMGTDVVSQQVAIGGALKAFDAQGNLVNDNQVAMLNSAVDKFFRMSRSLANEEVTCQIINNLYGEVNIAP